MTKTLTSLALHFVVAVVVLGLCSITSHAATIPFILDGNAGLGLLPGNEVGPVAEASSGGLGPGGITFDTVTKVLSIDVRWGSLNGFSDLTGVATGMHVHLATAPAPVGFGQNAAASIFLDALVGYNTSPTAGGFIGDTPAVSAVQEAAILGNQSYINVHTSAHNGGEIRGHLVAVPEPATFSVAVMGFVGFVVYGWRRRKQ